MTQSKKQKEAWKVTTVKPQSVSIRPNEENDVVQYGVSPFKIRQADDNYEFPSAGDIHFHQSHIGGSSPSQENSFDFIFRIKTALKPKLKEKNILASITLTDSEIDAMYQLVVARRKEYDAPTGVSSDITIFQE